MVTPFSWKRLRSLLRQRGLEGVKKAILRLLNKTGPGLNKDPLSEFLISQKINDKSLKTWAAKNNVKYRATKSLNNQETSKNLSAINIDYVIYAGGGIIKESFLKSVKGKILNPHSASLPEIRGMNACEWSLLLGVDPAVTVHFIDKGIDTGKVISKVGINKQQGDDIDVLRARCTVAGINEILHVMQSGLLNETDGLVGNAVESRQCFVLAPVLKELLQYKLKNNI